MALFEVKSVDTGVFESELRDFLPDTMIDIHTHVWLKSFRVLRKNDGRTVTWPSLVAPENPVDHLLETYRLMFPGKKVTPLIFSSLGTRQDDFTAANGYIADAAKKNQLPALLFARPDWDGDRLDEELSKGGFLGIKVYLSLSDVSIPRNRIAIFDFLPHAQLEVVNRRKGIVMLHIPRDARIKDPLNVAQTLTIAEKYTDLSLVIAHAGRAYCEEDMGDAFDRLAPARGVLFDISANTNAKVFETLLRKVGPERILFGSDLPITRMRMKRISESGRYVNLVGKGLYGDVSGDPNMREVSDIEAAQHTFFLYEEQLAFKAAAIQAGLNDKDVEQVFNGNAKTIIEQAGGTL
ncbi:MAG: amidohydrolase family protein [Fibrobacterota bacterium]